MRVGVIGGRAQLLFEEGAVDIAEVSDGRFGPDPLAVFSDWDAFREWAHGIEGVAAKPYLGVDLEAPVPTPRQVFAIGLNYRDHADESGVPYPDAPPVFTKFFGSLASPYGELRLPSVNVDWEVELVVVIGRTASNVRASEGWDFVAGLSVGQDYSERVVQAQGPVPQFSLGKSYPGFAPFGPWVVTLDEVADPDDLSIDCIINGESMQSSRTSKLIFSVGELIEKLSAVTPLLPGDLIFTGTPAGVGGARSPKLFLKPGDIVVSRIEGIGSIEQTCVA